MSEKRSRRLAAILAADVVGWSTLMRSDEEDILRRMRTLRSELIDPILSKRGGRIVKLMGDGMLIEFASSVARCRRPRTFRRPCFAATRAFRRTGGSCSASA